MTMELRPIRWGILSTALINKKWLAGAARTDAATIVALASRNLARARSYCDRWGIPKSYGSYDELLSAPDIEAVYIPLPNGLHHTWTMKALAAGKHVLCEKPYSANPEEVTAAFDLAATKGLVLSEAFMFRYHPQTRQLVGLVADGTIGDLRFINSAFSWPTDAPGDIRLNPELGGGSLVDVGCYCVSASRLLAGEPHRVTAQAITGPTGVEVRLVATMSFNKDVLSHFDSGFHLPDRSMLEVVGTDGIIRVADPWHCATAHLQITRPGRPPQVLTPEPANSYQLEIDEFASQVLTGQSRLLGRDDAVGQAKAIQRIYRAAGVGRAASDDRGE